MVQRIFLSKRFELSTISTVLTHDVPTPCQQNIKNMSENSDSDLLANCIYGVIECCEHWATLLPTQSKLESQARAYLLFLELCECGAEVYEGLIQGCLQEPKKFSRISILSQVSSDIVAVSNNSFRFLYLTIPMKDSIINKISADEGTGAKALSMIENALYTTTDLTELDIKIKNK